jgi:hypothetical protein
MIHTRLEGSAVDNIQHISIDGQYKMKINEYGPLHALSLHHTSNELRKGIMGRESEAAY